MKEKISIIVPIYNSEKYLKRCLDSIINQTYKNLDIILINDGSTDNSLKICKQYKDQDQRIMLINQKNHGVSYTKNKALKLATGDYIGFVDSDDVIDKDMFKNLHKLIEKTKSEIACCKYLRFTDDYKFEIKNNYQIYDKFECLKMLISETTITNFLWDKLFKRTVLEDIKIKSGIIFEDMDIIYEIIHKSTKIVVTDDILYGYYQRTDSYTHSYDYTKMLNYIDVYQKRYEFLSKNYPNLKKQIDSSLIYSIFILFRMITLNQKKEILDDKEIIKQYNKLKQLNKNINYFQNKLKKYLIKILIYNRYIFYHITTILYKIKGEY